MSSTPLDLMGKILDAFDDPCWKTLEASLRLPEIVVVGAQSSGKSSVLSEILGVRFPVSDDLCTKFVTRLVSRRRKTTSMTVTIIPDPARLEREQASLHNFKSTWREPKDVDKIIEAVARRLGVEQDDMFCRDVLEICVSSPESPSITLIDVPGFIEIPASEFQTQDDVDFIRGKLIGHMDNPKCLILAIVDGSKDISSNKVLDYATQRGREGRTIGILTKPDLIQGPRVLDRFVTLVTNENARYCFPLGWYVIRNRSPIEMDLDQKRRDENERVLLGSGRWASLPADRMGIESLRAGLTRQAVDFLWSQLAPLRLEVAALLSKVEADLSKLPKPVSSAQEARDVLYTHLNAISVELDRSFATPTSAISLPPTHGGSWMPQPSKLLEEFDELRDRLQEGLQGDASLNSSPYQGSPAPLLGQAQSLLRQFPPPFGGFPLEAARALYNNQTLDWSTKIAHHTSSVTSLLERHMRDLLGFCLPAHLVGGVFDVLVGPALASLSTSLRERSRLQHFTPASHPLPSNGLRPPIDMDLFSDSFLEGIRPMLELRRRRSIRDVVSQKFGVASHDGSPLPRPNGPACDLEELVQALEQTLVRDIFTADDIVIAVLEQRKVCNTTA